MIMNIRNYTSGDHEACIAIFKSNCPTYFEERELAEFDKWLTHRDTVEDNRPAYSNASADYYYVMEDEGEVVGCAGFYVTADGKAISMAWGMIHAGHHKKGYGTLLYQYRLQKVADLNQDLKITLNTSQYTFGFFEKMGLKVTKITPKGYGPNLDRYDMEE